MNKHTRRMFSLGFFVVVCLLVSMSTEVYADNASQIVAVPTDVQYVVSASQGQLQWRAADGAFSYKIFVNGVVVQIASQTEGVAAGQNISVTLATDSWQLDRLYAVEVSACAATCVMAESMKSNIVFAFKPTVGPVRMIDAGSTHSIALKTDGTIVTWGRLFNGQTFVDPAPPTSLLPELHSIVAVRAGGNHNLALRRDGRVFAWGASGKGQTTVPVNLTNAVEIAAGAYHSLALRSDGTVLSWGRYLSGNSHLTLSVPTGLNQVTDIDAGGGQAIARRADGTIAVWGKFTSSTLSAIPVPSNPTVGNASVPTSLTGVGITRIAAGGHHLLAMQNNQALHIWGNQLEGQATIPTLISQDLASASSATTLRDFAAGHAFSAAVRHDGTVVAWGKFYDGSKWQNMIVPSSLNLSTVTVPNASHLAVVLAAGGNHALVLRGDGSVTGWGRNDQGQTTIPAELKADQIAPTTPHQFVAHRVLLTSGVFESGSERYTLELKWSPSTDNVGVRGYNVFLNGKYFSFASTPSVTLTQLDLSANQQVTVSAVDNEQNRSALSVPFVINRETYRQYETPQVPTQLRVSQLSANRFVLQWNASVDNVGVRGYNVFRNGLYVASVAGTSYTFQNLVANSTHHLSVSAWDDNRFRSPRSHLLTVVTPHVVPQPTNVRATATGSAGQVRLLWDAPQTNGQTAVTISGFNVYRNGLYVASVTSPSYTFTGLVAGQTHNYQVLSYDTQRNRSNITMPLAFRTP